MVETTGTVAGAEVPPACCCDLVMKGGITSGIVFPRAIRRLSETFRLRNIAGTSAGAMAAAIAAAAEYGRANGKGQFRSLHDLPTQLGRSAPNGGGSLLMSLFQPEPGTAALFDLALVVMSKGAWWARLPRAVAILMFRMGVWPWVGLLAGVGVLVVLPSTWQGTSFGWALVSWGVAAVAAAVVVRVWGARAGRPLVAAITILAALAGLPLVVRATGMAPTLSPGAVWTNQWLVLLPKLGVIAGCLIAVGAQLGRNVPANGFGLCSGSTQESGRGTPGLTPWLHGHIQRLAGRGAAEAPLTFEDLAALPEDSSITLRIMTTCVTHGRPYLLPFHTSEFFYDPVEFAELFPPSVCGHLERLGRERVLRPDADTDARILYRAMHPRLPLATREMPILVAARMSLSFPVLLRGVSLWALDWSQPANAQAMRNWREWLRQGDHAAQLSHDPAVAAPAGVPVLPTPERCWFSDGGISSNFPVHLFDQALPGWPTFAINLRYREQAPAQRVELARTYLDGLEPEWMRLTRPEAKGPGSLLGFLGSIMGTMQNWNDNVMLSAPGYRDRIAHIYLGRDEGGLNLDMSSAQIEALAGYGEDAARQLAERFTRPPAGSELCWESHCWVRYRTSMALLERTLGGVVDSYRAARQPGGRTYPDLLARGDAPPTNYRWSPESAEAATEGMRLMSEFWDSWKTAGVDFGSHAPRPEVEWHTRPLL